MKTRRRVLLALMLAALVVGGALVARSPRARVRWLELRARSSDRAVREEARWALLASRPEIDDDEFVELVQAEARDMVPHGNEFLCTIDPPVTIREGAGATDRSFPTRRIAGDCPTYVDDQQIRFACDEVHLDSPGLVLAEGAPGSDGRVFPLLFRFVPLDPALAKRIEKIARP